MEGIIPAAAGQPVSTNAAVKRIVVVSAVDDITARAAKNGVVIVATAQRIVSVIAGNQIRFGPTCIGVGLVVSVIGRHDAPLARVKASYTQ